MNQFKEKYSFISALTTYDNNYKFDYALIDNLSKKHFDYIESHQNSSLLLKYFDSVLHDSPTIKITSSNDALAITLNNYHCYDFACETHGKFILTLKPRKNYGYCQIFSDNRKPYAEKN